MATRASGKSCRATNQGSFRNDANGKTFPDERFAFVIQMGAVGNLGGDADAAEHENPLGGGGGDGGIGGRAGRVQAENRGAFGGGKVLTAGSKG